MVILVELKTLAKKHALIRHSKIYVTFHIFIVLICSLFKRITHKKSILVLPNFAKAQKDITFWNFMMITDNSNHVSYTVTTPHTFFLLKTQHYQQKSLITFVFSHSPKYSVENLWSSEWEQNMKDKKKWGSRISI